MDPSPGALATDRDGRQRMGLDGEFDRRLEEATTRQFSILVTHEDGGQRPTALWFDL